MVNLEFYGIDYVIDVQLLFFFTKERETKKKTGPFPQNNVQYMNSSLPGDSCCLNHGQHVIVSGFFITNSCALLWNKLGSAIWAVPASLSPPGSAWLTGLFLLVYSLFVNLENTTVFLLRVTRKPVSISCCPWFSSTSWQTPLKPTFSSHILINVPVSIKSFPLYKKIPLSDGG